MDARRLRSIPRCEDRQDKAELKKLKHRVSSSFLLIKQMAKKTRKSSSKSRRHTRRRLPRKNKKGGAILPLPDAKAVEVSTAGESTDVV